MTHRTFDEQIANFNRVVSSWDINQEYKVALLGMIASLGYEHEKSITPEPHWIPCSGGLPKEEGFYLVTLEDKCGAETTIRFFRIENGERYWSLWGNENITAWMPKPEPMRLENK